MSFYTALTGLNEHNQIYRQHQITLLTLVLQASKEDRIW